MINILLTSKNVEVTADFYNALGVRLNKEKHGNGPEHFSFHASDVSIEIYPEHRLAQEETVLMRVGVMDVATAIARIRGMGYHSVGDDDNVKIFRDPDGRAIKLFKLENK